MVCFLLFSMQTLHWLHPSACFLIAKKLTQKCKTCGQNGKLKTVCTPVCTNQKSVNFSTKGLREWAYSEKWYLLWNTLLQLLHQYFCQYDASRWMQPMVTTFQNTSFSRKDIFQGIFHFRDVQWLMIMMICLNIYLLMMILLLFSKVCILLQGFFHRVVCVVWYKSVVSTLFNKTVLGSKELKHVKTIWWLWCVQCVF